MNRSVTFAGTVLGGIVAGVLLTTIATSTPVASGAESATIHADHLDAVARFGYSEVHRRSFRRQMRFDTID